MENKGDSARGTPTPTTVASSPSKGPSSDRECIKCSLCDKRLGRKNCLHQACVKCCTDPTCEPHREAREVLKKKESILEGTDWITRTANKKRASKVGPGAFYDSNIQYFGETVVIWDIKEFFSNQKWREDAMRRSRRRNDHVDLSALDGRRKRKRKEDDMAVAAAEKKEERGEQKKRPMSRKKRFKSICDELYRGLLD